MSHTFLIWWETLLVLEGKCLEFRTERVQITRNQDRRNWRGGGSHTQILTDSLTLFNLEGIDYTNYIITCPPAPFGFSGLPTALL